MKKRYTYTHEGDADRTLEVVGSPLEEAAGEFADADRTYVLRLDHIVVDFPTANILTETVITE
tara:strand:+ start:225 stop:413 length:189 start_codon:yes stop_codon:yes gene_type:complete